MNNNKIVSFLKNIVKAKGIKYTFVSNVSKIEYQRLMRIFNQNAIISGTELICLCRALDVKQEELMRLIEFHDIA